MFIKTESTPNPNSLKFLPESDVMGNRDPMNFNSKEQASSSPLAEMLFKFDFIKNVFLGSDFVTVTKAEDIHWDVIKPDILVTIMEFFVTGKKILKNPEEDSENPNQINENDSEIVKQIKEIIEHRVRPAVANDGGDIIFRAFESGVVYLELFGSCSGCPSSTVTLKNGIESMLKHYVPEVMSVEAIN